MPLPAQNSWYNNVTDPLALTDYVTLAETIKTNGVVAPYTGITFSGIYPAGGGSDRVNGLVLSINDAGYASVATGGIAIGKVQPGVTIVPGNSVFVTVSGLLSPVVGSEKVLGIARDGSIGSTNQAPHYIRVRFYG